MTDEVKVGIAAGMIKEARHVQADMLDTVSHVTFGSFTYKPREGNKEPTTYFNEETGLMLNAVGLRNEGLTGFILNDLDPLAHLFTGVHARLRVSLAPTEAGELAAMCAQLAYSNVVEHISELEINAACPNHRTGKNLHPVLAYDPEAVEKLLLEAMIYRAPKALKIAPRTPPDTLRMIVEHCCTYGIGAIVSGNTLKHSAVIDGAQRLSVAEGGMSGTPLFADALAQVELLAPLCHSKGIRLYGCGGVMNAESALRMHRAGADELQTAALFWTEGWDGVAKLVYAANLATA